MEARVLFEIEWEGGWYLNHCYTTRERRRKREERITIKT